MSAASTLAPSLLNTLLTQRMQEGLTVDEALTQIESQAQKGELADTITAYDRALAAIDQGIRAAAARAAG